MKEGLKIMDKNLFYIENIKVDEIPWHRITTAYGRATEFPQYLRVMWDMADKVEVKKALNEVANNIEHQGTLWHSTPFAMIFLVRIFRKAISEKGNNEMADFITEQLLNFLMWWLNVIMMQKKWNMQTNSHFSLICLKKNICGQRNIARKKI